MTVVIWQELTSTWSTENSHQAESESHKLKNDIPEIPSFIICVKSWNPTLQETQVVDGGKKLITSYGERKHLHADDSQEAN